MAPESKFNFSQRSNFRDPKDARANSNRVKTRSRSKMERLSPVSFDSGFDSASSFPSSPETSNDGASGIPLLNCFAHFPSVSSENSITSVNTSDSSSTHKESVFTNSNSFIISEKQFDENKKVSLNEEMTIVESCKNCAPSTSSSIEFDYELEKLVSRPECQESLCFPCLWEKCKSCYTCDNDLYDHVIKDHLEILHPSEMKKSPRTGISKKKKKKSVEAPICLWNNCKKVLSRGDYGKQFAWLEEHFRTRHAGKAQPYKCLIANCTLRFSSKSLLSDHLQNGHNKIKEKKTNAMGKFVPKIKCGLRWVPIPYYVPGRNTDFLDEATDRWIFMRLKEYEETPQACLVASSLPNLRGGAKYRKQRRLLTFSVESSSPRSAITEMDVENTRRLLKNAFIKTR